jgi:hypothetical protein
MGKNLPKDSKFQNSDTKHFYFPHMEYDGSIGLVSRRMIQKLADFHFLLATYGIWGKYWFSVEKNEIFFRWFSFFWTFY